MSSSDTSGQRTLRTRPRAVATLATSLVLVAAAVVLASGPDPLYELPFEPESEHHLVQGNDGPYGHSGVNEFAFDFSMPIGTNVTAMRGGVVVRVVEEHADAEPRHPEPGNENYVIIDHGDGTFGRYYHLTRDGALVEEGDEVTRGQVIGRSGNSGASFLPHLHVDVTEGCFEWGCPTRYIEFSAVDNPLVTGVTVRRPASAEPPPG